MPRKPVSTASLRQGIDDKRARDSERRWRDSIRPFWREKPPAAPSPGALPAPPENR